MAFAGRLDQPKLLRDLVCPELLPPAAHQGLRGDRVLDQAFGPQADETVLAERGVRVGVPYPLQGRQATLGGSDPGVTQRERNRVPGTSPLPCNHAGSISPGFVSPEPLLLSQLVFGP